MQYYVRFKGKRIGPLDEQRVELLLSRGQLTAHHEISDTEGVWQRIGQWQESQATGEATGNEPNAGSDDPAAKGTRHSESDDGLPPTSGAVAAASDQWHVAFDGEQSGPYSEAKVGEMIRDGQIVSRSQVWRSGMDQWRNAEDVFPGAIRASHQIPRDDPVDAGDVAANMPQIVVDSFAARRVWVTTVCVFAYTLSLEMFAVAVLLIIVIAKKIIPDGPVIFLPVMTVSAFVLAVLLLAIAIHLTRLSSAMNVFVTHGTATGYRSLARHENRMWLTAVAIGSFLGIVHVTMLFILLSI